MPPNTTPAAANRQRSRRSCPWSARGRRRAGGDVSAAAVAAGVAACGDLPVWAGAAAAELTGGELSTPRPQRAHHFGGAVALCCGPGEGTDALFCEPGKDAIKSSGDTCVPGVIVGLIGPGCMASSVLGMPAGVNGGVVTVSMCKALRNLAGMETH